MLSYYKEGTVKIEVCSIYKEGTIKTEVCSTLYESQTSS